MGQDRARQLFPTLQAPRPPEAPRRSAQSSPRPTALAQAVEIEEATVIRVAHSPSGNVSGCEDGVDLSDRKPHTALRARAGHLLVRGRSELACDRHGGLLGRLYESN